MKNKSLLLSLALLLTGILIMQACRSYSFRSNYLEANKLLHGTKNLRTKPFLKAHLKNGDICIFNSTWKVDTVQNLVAGIGSRYDFNRSRTFTGNVTIPIDSVAIFETNNKIVQPEAGRITALSILTGVNVAVGIFCLANPKACFGSCPTFYINEADNFHYADAEGFSNAILPSMEYGDIDALNNKPVTGNSFSLTMKNEALETHCLNAVKLLACPRKKGERVYQSPANDFYLCENTYPVAKAVGPEGDITHLIRNHDRQERFSLADEKNLSSREEIYLHFEKITDSRDLGLIVNFRQTLLTTYLFYSAMGYMGDNVGDLFARLETDEALRNKFDATTKELGKIEVYVWQARQKQWQRQDAFYETGPIAINRQLLPLKNLAAGSEVKLKLVVNKGLWRIDYLALTNIKAGVKPVEIAPNSILNKGIPDPAALASLLKTDKYLISMPGSEYKFTFPLPEPGQDYELFLYSKGYYLEWMRDHWLKDKNLLKLQQMVENPKRYLREEAGAYKRYESTMEQEFWNSKIDTKTFSFYEN